MTDQLVADATTASDGKIVCHIDNARVHVMQSHLQNNHPDWTIERYKREFPGEPVLSKMAEEILAQKARKKAEEAAAKSANPGQGIVANAATIAQNSVSSASLIAKSAAFHELFELGNAPAALASGKPIAVTVLEGHDSDALMYLPAVDDRYVFNIDLLKKAIIGLELGYNVLFWGYHGTGKTTILEQACARTKRPVVRVQHTINMQESDVLGQWTVRNGATEFQLGPLPMAMLNGWTYLADEYDFAMPSVTSVYQPVLEHKPLLIKEAPPHFRYITPHPQFRFLATGNTNGTGDETGLYQGTLIQNAANYSRFEITAEVEYMDAKTEENILISRCDIDRATAGKIVKFANEVRKYFKDGKINTTISPRELISATNLGIAYAGNWLLGMELAYANRCTRVDRKTVLEYAQRLLS
jgi:cobaltochelatase CobS